MTMTKATPTSTTSAVLWLTGLSGAGKTTLSRALHERLARRGTRAALLDGDVLRKGISADLGYSPEDRTENVRRAAHVARLMSAERLVVVVALISPMTSQRALARRIVGAPFREVFVHAPLPVCIERDPKGLYKRALAGKLAQFTGVSAPYEPPPSPELVLDTSVRTIDDCCDALHALL